jgi:DNA-binding Lrp family transcriptional regulator
MLNEKDKKILRELIKDGRISYADLGRKVHMTRQSVYSRIKSLQHRGIIRGFSVNVDKKKLGLNIIAYILMDTDLKALKSKEIESLIKLPQITEIHHIFGRHSIILEIRAKDMNELTGLIKRIHEFPYIRKTETLIVHTTRKFKPEHSVEGILK